MAIALFIGRSHFFKVAITRKTLYPALTQALQEMDMTLQPGTNSTSWSSAWNNGKTKTIRVPVKLADQILNYARELDSGIDMEQQIILKFIDSFAERRKAEFRPNQYSRTASLESRRWDELKRFRNLVANGDAKSESSVESLVVSVRR